MNKILHLNPNITLLKSVMLLVIGTAFTMSPVNAQTASNTTANLGVLKPVDVSKDVTINADELEANLRKDIVIFVGNVVVQQKDLTLTSDRVTVFYRNGKEEKASITRIDASGSVKLKTLDETIHATWGIYDFTEKIITLGGKVVLKRSDGEIKGKKLIYNLDTGLISIEGNSKNNDRVKGQFKLLDE